MADTMRGVYTNLTEIRRNVFAEVAKIAYAQGAGRQGRRGHGAERGRPRRRRPPDG
jgi:hypothetical protein